MHKAPPDSTSPSPLVSLIPVAVLILLMTLVIKLFGSGALYGGSQVALIIAAGVTIAVSMGVYHNPWKELEESIEDNLKAICVAMLILLMIGTVSSSWMLSGIVPAFICYGLQCISPKVFLLAVCLICAIVAVVTGSSWTTIATIGVAMIAIGEALGFSPAWTAGAIISGAYFGDKISPLSDTTVLASSTAGVPLFEHIKYMMITTVPSFAIALIIFLIASLCHTAPSAAVTSEVSDALRRTFNITPVVLIVPAVTCFLIVKKVPALLTLLLASAMAGVMALIVQPDIMAEVAGADRLTFESASRATFLSYFNGAAIDSGNESLNRLIETKGMNGMLPTVFLIICAANFGGTLVGSGMIQSITGYMMRRISSRVGLVASSVFTGIFCNMATSDQYLSIILNCSLYRELFEDKGYEPRLLSRTAEDSTTVTSVLIPWNSCGMTQSTVLHVPTMTYLPYCFFNLISPLMSILVAATGYKIYRSVISPQSDSQSAPEESTGKA
ncbi:MAG: sodium:proton antiporter [Bacteroidales bacterium]|nr:sodium:proton antiporter [Bacteroidales bacterium]